MGGVGVLHWEDWRKAWKLQVENEQEEWGKESSRPLGRYDFVQAIDLVAPSVVKISVAHEDFGFFGLHGVLESSGSGFVLTSDGKIATNAHVVAGPQAGRVSGKLLVTLHDGRTFPGKVSGMDVLSDLALVEVGTCHFLVWGRCTELIRSRPLGGHRVSADSSSIVDHSCTSR